jgi:RimK-like ATP-grasp domain
MILIYGRLDDPPLASTVEALQEAGASFVLLEQTTLDREELCIEVSPGGVGGSLVVAGQELPLDSVHSIYARALELPVHSWDRVRAASARLLHQQLWEWLDVSPALVVNRPRAMHANGSKPLQIQLIGESGFLVPETLVTSDEAEAREFWRRHGRVVYKSASGVRSIVQELDERAAARLGRLQALPVQFQAFVPGIDVRVHVVGTRTFAAAIVGSGTDYRYSALKGGETTLTATDLAPDVAARCVALSRQMELPFSGIDLRRRPDGAYVCFEVNPMPAYTYFEAHTGLPISQALCEMLISGLAEPVEVADGTSHRESDPTCWNHRRSPAAS